MRSPIAKAICEIEPAFDLDVEILARVRDILADGLELNVETRSRFQSGDLLQIRTSVPIPSCENM